MRTTAARPAGLGHEPSRHLEHQRHGARALSPAGRGPARPAPSEIVTVFRGADGMVHHGWCGRTLEYLGRSARLELDFYCPQCFEHVSVPECTLARIPVAPSVGIPLGAAA